MNTKILQKCIDELKSKTPNLSYLRGMLETLYDMQETVHEIKTTDIREIPKDKLIPLVKPTDDEQSILDAKAKANLAEIMKMATIEEVTHK